jgi:hypothetical protein
MARQALPRPVITVRDDALGEGLSLLGKLMLEKPVKLTDMRS